MTSLTTHPRKGARLAALAALTLGLFAGCGLSTHGTGSSGGKDTCTSDAQCDDGDPCTDDTCTADQLCTHKTRDDGPAPGLPDDTACGVNQCLGGKPGLVPVHNGAACKNAQKVEGTCTSGVCEVHCGTDDKCPDMGPCTSASCDLTSGKCVLTDVADGTPTPGFTQVAGDCSQKICSGGVSIDLPDASDVPVPVTDCVIATCDNGTPKLTSRPIDSPCSTAGGQVCNGSATDPKCVECNDPSSVDKCPGPNDECSKRACINNVCKIQVAIAGTLVSGQTTGDCLKNVCDGSGAIISQPDTNDAPDDGNPCTADTCSNGQPVHTPMMAGTACGVGKTCDASGACSCATNADCQAPDTCGGGNPGKAGVCGCTKIGCGNVTCGTIPDGCYGTLDCDNGGAKNGNETDVDCGGNPATCATRCAQGKKCTTGADCASTFCVDGVCCDSACGDPCKACSAMKKGTATADGVCGPIKAGTDPNNDCAPGAAGSCGLSGTCDGAGQCALTSAGTVCKAGSCSGTTFTKPDKCDGSGTCLDGGTQDCGNYACTNAGCKVLCGGDADCAAGNFCALGGCFAKKANGQLCTSNNQCISNKCHTNGLCGP